MRLIYHAAVALTAVSLCAPSARADDKADMNALLAKAIQAAGGEEFLTKNQASVQSMTGTISAMGIELEFSGTFSAQLPDQLRNELSLNVGGMQITQVVVYDGKAGKGWISVNGETMEMDEDLFKESKEEMHAAYVVSQLVGLKDDKVYELAPLAEIEVNGKPALGMEVSRAGHRDVMLYFDKQSHLLVKQEFQTVDFMGGGGQILSEAIYSDYEKVGGAMVPKSVKIKRDGEDFLDAKVTDYTASESLPKGTFDKP